MELHISKILPFVCVFFLSLMPIFYSRIGEPKYEQEICPICLETFKPEDSFDENLGKKMLFTVKRDFLSFLNHGNFISFTLNALKSG